MTIVLNGQPHEIAPGTTMADVVAVISSSRTGLAAALDDAVVPRSAWSSTEVPEGARVEILTAVQGG